MCMCLYVLVCVYVCVRICMCVCICCDLKARVHLILIKTYTTHTQHPHTAFALLAHRKPHIVILDEPKNHLDMDTIQALIEAVSARARACAYIFMRKTERGKERCARLCFLFSSAQNTNQTHTHTHNTRTTAQGIPRWPPGRLARPAFHLPSLYRHLFLR